jgi:TonB family protein
MKSLAIALSLSAFAACAPTTQAEPQAPAPLGVQLPSRVAGDIELTKLEPVARLQLERRGQARTQVAVCVGPDGRVADATLIAGSGVEGYDRAVLDSVRQWTYRQYAAGEDSRVCKTVSVVYRSA